MADKTIMLVCSAGMSTSLLVTKTQKANQSVIAETLTNLPSKSIRDTIR